MSDAIDGTVRIPAVEERRQDRAGCSPVRPRALLGRGVAQGRHVVWCGADRNHFVTTVLEPGFAAAKLRTSVSLMSQVFLEDLAVVRAAAAVAAAVVAQRWACGRHGLIATVPLRLAPGHRSAWTCCETWRWRTSCSASSSARRCAIATPRVRRRERARPSWGRGRSPDALHRQRGWGVDAGRANGAAGLSHSKQQPPVEARAAGAARPVLLLAPAGRPQVQADSRYTTKCELCSMG